MFERSYFATAIFLASRVYIELRIYLSNKKRKFCMQKKPPAYIFV